MQGNPVLQRLFGYVVEFDIVAGLGSQAILSEEKTAGMGYSA